MKLLFDQNISFRITKELSNFYPESKHVSECGLDDHEDPDIWQFAKKNHYSIVTFDSDFYDISIMSGHPPKIIWLRTGNLKTKEIAQVLIYYKKAIENFIEDIEASCLEIN